MLQSLASLLLANVATAAAAVQRFFFIELSVANFPFKFTSPPFPKGDLSFLNGIPAIGTKFDLAENHSPESQKNKAGSEWIRGTFYFDFR